MNEEDYLSCRDPGSLLWYLRHSDKVNIDQERFWVLACRGWTATSETRWAPLLTHTLIANAATDWADHINRAGVCPRPIRADLLRCVVGNPFRPLTIPHDDWKDPKNKVIADWKLETKSVIWLSCITPDVIAMVRAAREGDLGVLPVLADALEEAGCEDVKCSLCPEWKGMEIGSGDAVQAVINWNRAKKACRCHGTARIPHPALAHLRSPHHCVDCHYLVEILKAAKEVV